MRRIPVFLFLLLILPPVGLGAAPVAPSAEAPRLNVVEHTLKNGMKFLIVPRKVSPTVAAYIRFKVGGVDDPAGQTGIAHLLEHMMFKGTTTFGTTSYRAEKPLMEKLDKLNLELQEILYRQQTSHFSKADERRIGDLRAEIAKTLGEQKKLIVKNELSEAYSRLGGIGLNASTSNDYTTYVIQLPSNALEAWAYLEADRIANPVFREFYSERDVVHEERRRGVDTQGRGMLGEAFTAAAWTAHPYRNPVVGWSSDIDNTKRDEVLAFFRTYYAPNNAIAAVVGDVDTQEVIRLAEKYFGPIPSQPKPFRTLSIEPPQNGERRITVRFDASPVLQIGYPIPAIGHPDAPALEVVGNLLSGVRGGGGGFGRGGGGSRTTRFFQAIMQKGLGQASADGGTGPYPNLFGISATPRRPTTPEQLEQAIYAEISRLQTEPVPEREMERVRNQVDAQMVRAGGSNAGIAMRLLNDAAMTGDANYYYRHRELLKAVTAADVMRVAKQYLTPDKRTVATLVPTSDAGASGRPGSGPPRGPGSTGGRERAMSTMHARGGRWNSPKWHAKAAPTPASRATRTAILDPSGGVEVAHGIGVGAALACYSGASCRHLGTRAGSCIAVVALTVFTAAVSTAAPAGPARRSEHSEGYKRVMAFPRKPVQLRVPRVGREVERRVLSNGIVLYLMEDRERPLVRMEAVVRGGTDYVPRDQELAMGMLGSQMRQGGTKSRTFEQLNDDLEFVGASVEARTGGEQSSASLDVLAKDLDLGLKLFADVIMHPAFDARQLEITKGQTIEGIRRRNDQPASILGRYFTRMLYTSEHPAGRSGFTTIAEVTAVNTERLAALHRRYFGPNNTWIAVVGDFDRSAIAAKIEAAFAGWAPVEKAAIEKEKANLPRAAGKNVPGVFVIQRPLNQASISLGHFGVDWNNPDRFALNVMNYILGGGGFTSRIMERVRSDEGLAYAVSTQFPISSRDLDLFRATLQTKTESTGPAIQAILEEIERIRTEPVSAQELELAKEDFINSYIFRFDSSFTNVTQLMQLELDDRPRDYYETLLDKYRAVTREEILRVAQKYLHPKELTILVVGDTQQVGPALAKFGPVKPLTLEAVE